MAWNFAQQKENWAYPAVSTGQTNTFGSNCTPGSLLLALVSAYTGTPNNTAVSDPTNGTWKYIGNVVGGYGNMSVYYVVNTSSSALAVSWGGSLTYPAFQIAEFTGNNASPLDRYTTNTGVTGTPVVAGGLGELIVGFPCPNSAGNMEAAAGWISTLPGDSTGQPMIYNAETLSGNYTPTFTNSGGVISVSFFPTTRSAITFVQCQGGGNSGVSSFTVPITPTAGNALVIGTVSSVGSATAADSHGNAFTMKTQVSLGGTNFRFGYLTGIASGIMGITVSAGSSGYLTLMVAEYEGLASTPADALDSTGSTSSGTSWQGGSITPTSGLAEVICGYCLDESGLGNLQASGNYATRYNAGTSFGGGAAFIDQIVASTSGAYQPTGTCTSGDSVYAVSASFKAPAAVVSSANLRMLMGIGT